jgi:hypothetical protein
VGGRYRRQRSGRPAGPGPRVRARPVGHAVIAAAAVLTIVAGHWPWFQATLTPPDVPVIAPQGTATGLYAHPSLWVATGLAAAQLGLLLAHYSPRGRVRLGGDVGGSLLSLTSGAISVLAVADTLLLPRPWAPVLAVTSITGAPALDWEGIPDPLDGTTLFMTWRYGATVAVGAALVSLAAAIVLVMGERRQVLRARRAAPAVSAGPNVGDAA